MPPSFWAVALCCLKRPPRDEASGRGDETPGKATLSKKGIRVSHAGFTVPGETEFVKAVSAASALRRKLSAESSQEQSTESGDEGSAARIDSLTQQNVALKQRLTELNQVGFAFRGQMVQQTKNQIATNDREIARLQQAQKQSAKSAEGTRKDAKSGREAYHKQVSDARALGDQLIAEYSTLNHDKEVAAAIKEYNQAAHVSHKLRRRTVLTQRCGGSRRLSRRSSPAKCLFGRRIGATMRRRRSTASHRAKCRWTPRWRRSCCRTGRPSMPASMSTPLPR